MTKEERALLLAVADGVAALLVAGADHAEIRLRHASTIWREIGQVTGSTDYDQRMRTLTVVP